MRRFDVRLPGRVGRNVVARAALMASTALLGACAAGDIATTGFAVRDTVVLHGGLEHRVEIAENPAPGTALRTWRVAEQPDLTIGGADAEGEFALFQVASTFRLADDRIVVADGGSKMLKFFDSTGELVGTAGGPGEGPGEFRRLENLSLLQGDTLVVWDLWQARVTTFAPNGQATRSTRIGTTSGSPAGNIIGVFDDGSFLARAFITIGDDPPSGLRRDPSPLLHLAPDGTLADSLDAVPGGEAFYQPIDGGFSVYLPPFARSTELVAAGNYLYLGDTGRPEIRVQRPDGSPVRLIRWAEPGRPVTATDAAQARRWILERNDSEFRRPHVERMLREVPLPERMPAFFHILVDSEAHLWVAEYRTPWDEGDIEWLVFADNGRMVARVYLPELFRPTHIGTDFILGIATDEFDVEQVRLYRLERS